MDQNIQLLFVLQSANELIYISYTYCSLTVEPKFSLAIVFLGSDASVPLQ